MEWVEDMDGEKGEEKKKEMEENGEGGEKKVVEEEEMEKVVEKVQVICILASNYQCILQLNSNSLTNHITILLSVYTLVPEKT